MSKFARRGAIVLAIGLVVFGVWAAARAPRSAAQSPSLVSMAESAQAMQKAGDLMQTHGQVMIDEGKRSGNSELLAHGQHWLTDGQALTQGGGWMAANPTAPSSLHASPSDLKAQGSWNELDQNAQAMLHDPSQASNVNLDALRFDGLAMKDEGQNMADHGTVMAEDVKTMVEQGNLKGQDATDLRQAAQTMQDVGNRLTNNGQQMIDYADRLRRSLGLP